MKYIGYTPSIYNDGGEFTEAMSDFDETTPATAIMELDLGAVSGLSVLRALDALGKPVSVIYLTVGGTVRSAVEAMKTGAVDFLVQPVRDQDLIEAVDSAMRVARRAALTRASKNYSRDQIALLSPRERDVCNLICKGLLNKQIAFELRVTEASVKVYRKNAMRKLGVHSLSAFYLGYHNVFASMPPSGAALRD